MSLCREFPRATMSLYGFLNLKHVEEARNRKAPMDSERKTLKSDNQFTIEADRKVCNNYNRLGNEANITVGIMHNTFARDTSYAMARKITKTMSLTKEMGAHLNH